MKNNTLIDYAKVKLKELLAECTEPQQHMFKKMYSHNNLELPINEVIDKMDSQKIDWALTQVERTIEKNKPKA